jgi:acyl carrier protein
VLGRHGVLAQAFSERDGLAYVRPAECAPQLSQVDLGALPSGQRELEDQMSRGIKQPFDLRKGPLVRMTLYSLGPSRHVLLLVAHHLIFDGLSMEIFTRDLLRLYELAVSGREQDLPGLRHPSGEYAAFEKRRVAAILPDARLFWNSRWKEPEQMLLPGVTGPVRTVDAGEQVGFTIDGSPRAELLNVCRDLDITEFDFLLASLHCLLYRYGNDVPVVTIALGLRPVEYNENIGSFAQELPFALPVKQGMSFREFATSLHASLRELYKYRMVPLNRVMAGVRPSSLHTMVALSYLPVKRTVQLPGLAVRVDRMPNSWVRGALSALAHADDSTLSFIIRYPSRALTPDGAQRIAGHWRQVIERVTADPDASISALPVLSEAERETMAVSPPAAVPELVEPGLAAAREVDEVRQIWREVLKIGDIGIQDNLFDFGVDSLAVNRISSAIYRKIGVDIPLETFYDSPTIIEIADIIVHARREDGNAR